jgi:hypothetical protein
MLRNIRIVMDTDLAFDQLQQATISSYAQWNPHLRFMYLEFPSLIIQIQ